jgi:hypothetical protein
MMEVDATAIRTPEVDRLATPSVEVTPGLSAPCVLLVPRACSNCKRFPEVAVAYHDVKVRERAVRGYRVAGSDTGTLRHHVRNTRLAEHLEDFDAELQGTEAPPNPGEGVRSQPRLDRPWPEPIRRVPRGERGKALLR